MDQSKKPRGVRLPGSAAPRNCHKIAKVRPARARKKGGTAHNTSSDCMPERPAQTAPRKAPQTDSEVVAPAPPMQHLGTSLNSALGEDARSASSRIRHRSAATPGAKGETRPKPLWGEGRRQGTHREPRQNWGAWQRGSSHN